MVVRLLALSKRVVGKSSTVLRIVEMFKDILQRLAQHAVFLLRQDRIVRLGVLLFVRRFCVKSKNIEHQCSRKAHVNVAGRSLNGKCNAGKRQCIVQKSVDTLSIIRRRSRSERHALSVVGL